MLNLTLNTESSATNNPISNNNKDYTYKSVEGDPLKTRLYTLDNGLKVYLSVNKNEPRIYTHIAVRAGSKNDPAETTGLAHYLEHMMFKGTSKIGTKNWEKESELLNKISDLYEQHRNTESTTEKAKIYKQIDSLSFEAAKFAIPNEFDKMISSMGAKGTNAYTSNEKTVYINDVPSNELEKWAKLESERFQTLVLRLFHTELETVYEEFNRSEDNDYRKSFKSLYEGLYPNHPFGTQTTLGLGEHLKNPSMVNIHNYFNTYYRPNNCAVVLTGDFEYDEAIALIDKYFGAWQPGEIPEFTFEQEKPITEPVVFYNYGSQAEHLYMAWRLPGAGTQENMLMQLCAGILQNGQAGLIDLNLQKEQKLLQANLFDITNVDYAALMVYGQPRQGQNLEEVKNLLLAEIEKLSTGDFDDYLLEAVINNFKYQDIKRNENNQNRGGVLVNAFILNISLEEITTYYEKMAKITKADIQAFAKKYLNNTNYVVAYKHNGEDKNTHKVEKPLITPVEINRNEQSEFMQAFNQMESGRLKPQFLDFEKQISQSEVSGNIPFYYIKNELNPTFGLFYIFEMGKAHNQDLPLALNLLPYLGTNKYSPAELSKEFFKLGVEFQVSTSDDKCYVYLTGLEKSLEEGIALFEYILANVKPDQATYNGYVQDILKRRDDKKLDKGYILRMGMVNYAKFGEKSPSTDIISAEGLKNKDIENLSNTVKDLANFEHQIFYYGQAEEKTVKQILKKYHKTPENLKPIPAKTIYPELPLNESKVYVVNYDMKQVEMMLLAKDEPFNKNIMPQAGIFNEYFGAGLSSIVFQEIREAKALAYSAYSYFTGPRNKEDSHYAIAYIGTQADKLNDAVAALLDLMNEMPEAQEQFESARISALKKIESERITKSNIFWTWESNKKRGYDYDIRKDNYEAIKNLQFEDLQAFFDTHIKGKQFTYLVIGNIADLDMTELEKLGEVEVLSLEKICGY